jgi:hypothetical protein
MFLVISIFLIGMYHTPLVPIVATPIMNFDKSSFWRLHEDAELGYELVYPSRWVKTLRPILPDLIGETSFMSRYDQPEDAPKKILRRSALSPNANAGNLSVSPQYIIEVGNRFYEVSEGVSLAEWTSFYLCEEGEDHDLQEIQMTSWPFSDPEISEAVYVTGPHHQFIHIKRGSIVWFLAANFGYEADLVHSAIFHAAALSFQFSPDAPRTYEQIYVRSPDELSLPPKEGKEGCILNQA